MKGKNVQRPSHSEGWRGNVVCVEGEDRGAYRVKDRGGGEGGGVSGGGDRKFEQG